MVSKAEDEAEEHHTSENVVGDDTYMGDITKGSNCGGDVKRRGLIPPPFSPSINLDNFEYKNYNDDGYIYNNYVVPEND